MIIAVPNLDPSLYIYIALIPLIHQFLMQCNASFNINLPITLKKTAPRT